MNPDEPIKYIFLGAILILRNAILGEYLEINYRE